MCQIYQEISNLRPLQLKIQQLNLQINTLHQIKNLPTLMILKLRHSTFQEEPEAHQNTKVIKTLNV